MTSISAAEQDGNVLCGLDLLRFLLSVAILVVHMPLFSAPPVDLDSLDRNTLPFASALGYILV